MLICCFFHLAGKISTHGIFRHADMSTYGPKLACRRPGTKYCVDLFFYFRTLWNPPTPSDVIFSSVSSQTSDPTFHHGLCFFASLAAFCSRPTPPILVRIARQRAVRCRGHWRLRRCCVIVVGGGGGSRDAIPQPFQPKPRRPTFDCHVFQDFDREDRSI